MPATQYYNLDAFRYTRDLRDKCLSSFSYVNILLTCYDASVTWLKDVYFSSNCYPPIQEVTLKSLVETLESRHHKLCSKIKNYSRFYHTYYLVLGGHLAPKNEELSMAIECLISIIEFWVAEAPMENVINLYEFILPNIPLTEIQKDDNHLNREHICEMCGLTTKPCVFWED